ncbi:MAG: DUF1579 domain-containing protein [Ktedonobacterales bacterium]
MDSGNNPSGSNDFDFLQGAWTNHNRRRTEALYPEREGVWQEFTATHMGEKLVDGKVIIEHFEGTLPDGEVRKAITIRTFDPETQQWSIVWLDNRNPADFRPLVGKFEDGVGYFYQAIASPSGQPIRVRFIWDQITEHTARWQQAFSFDGGKTWDTNWIMEFTR